MIREATDQDVTVERKFVADARGEPFARAWLSHVCLPDRGYPVGTVSSIYYDTLALQSYREKLNGDFVKSKVRLRWYDTPAAGLADLADAFLEVKRRVGAGRTKLRTPLVLPRPWLEQVSLDDDGLRELPYRRGADLVDLLPSGLHPMIAVTYERRRFICPLSGTRISLDTNIGTSKANGRLLPPASGDILDAVVVEIKASRMDDVPWVEALYRHGFRQRAFSKYAACLSRAVEGGGP